MIHLHAHAAACGHPSPVACDRQPRAIGRRARASTVPGRPLPALAGPVAARVAARVAAMIVALVGVAPALAQPVDMRRGETLFSECSACHAMQEGAHGVGPSLAGIAGRRAATIDGFRYSPALRRATLTWSAQTLDAFIADPQKVVPGNRMPYSGLAQERDRADLVAWILRAPRP